MANAITITVAMDAHAAAAVVAVSVSVRVVVAESRCTALSFLSATVAASSDEYFSLVAGSLGFSCPFAPCVALCR